MAQALALMLSLGWPDEHYSTPSLLHQRPELPPPPQPPPPSSGQGHTSRDPGKNPPSLSSLSGRKKWQ